MSRVHLGMKRPIRQFEKSYERFKNTINYLENIEFESLEEKKIPEKLKIEQDGHTYNNFYIVNQNGTKCYLTKHSKMIVETLNQLIDYLKSKGE